MRVRELGKVLVPKFVWNTGALSWIAEGSAKEKTVVYKAVLFFAGQLSQELELKLGRV